MESTNAPYVVDRLTDHGAAGHAAEKTGDDVGHTLSAALPALVAARVREIVHNRGSHQRFKDADHGERERIRQDDQEGFEI
jgi:hypothetical protein